MITLLTGVPGTFKTSSLIHEIYTNPLYEGRPVYYYNIKDLKIPGWIELTLEETQNWHLLPPNSILIIDEAYKVFPRDKPGALVPDYINRLAEHRHYGIDIWLICQKPIMIHSFPREMAGVHHHNERPFSMPYYKRYSWEEVRTPINATAKKEALRSRHKPPKSVYGLYHSAEVHTHKARIPKIVYFLIPLFLSGWYAGYHVIAKNTQHENKKPDVHEVTKPIKAAETVTPQPTKAVSLQQNKWQSKEDYEAAFRPRIANEPWTAPAYDQLTGQIRSFPKPSCIIRTSDDHCTCYSQQGTFLNIEHDACVSLVKYGRFDHTLADTNTSIQNQPTAAAVTAEQAAAAE